ncbi:MAG: amidohydrolase family protein [Deltaproteobacteria bacterium]|nr:amidohydrolase family protein [Deltaproteobacteria bacterium]
MAYDFVIRGGSVMDGSGARARQADLAIAGDRIAAIGRIAERGAREIDAAGCWVTPGFVDIHTHLDAQLAWDPLGSSSCWHGVTSVVIGNCGVTFAPVRARDRETLARMMESVEDIPARSILEGLPFDWEGYGGFLDWLERVPKGLNVGGMVGHCAARYFAMGERSLDPDAAPSASELAALTSAVDDALAAGALGFSSSRTLRHKVPDGRYVPGTFARADELLAIADVLARRGGRVFEVAPRFDGEGPSEPRVESELAWMEAVSKRSGGVLTFNLSQTRGQGAHWQLALSLAKAANARGAKLRPQTAPRFIGVLTGIAHRTPFDFHPSWRALSELSLTARLAVLRDPARRGQLVAEARADRDSLAPWFVLNGPAGRAQYDCRPENKLLALAERRGVLPVEAFIDLALETEGKLLLCLPFLNQDEAPIGAMLGDEVVLMGLADAGAHVGLTMDASAPTYLLSHWVLARGALSPERAVQRLTSDTARAFGIAQRGELRVGSFADVNVIDPARLALPVPEYVHDFPNGAGRFAQRASGYAATFVNGQPFMQGGVHTGALAGRVLRGGVASN